MDVVESNYVLDFRRFSVPSVETLYFLLIRGLFVLNFFQDSQELWNVFIVYSIIAKENLHGLPASFRILTCCKLSVNEDNRRKHKGEIKRDEQGWGEKREGLHSLFSPRIGRHLCPKFNVGK